MMMMRKKDIKAFRPANHGWLQYQLNSQEMDYVWRCIKNKKEDYKHELAGNISSSYSLIDRGDWFFTNTLNPLIHIYGREFGPAIVNSVPIMQRHPPCLSKWWVNYQRQNEFNPLHNHSGVYSFVIWMKIPISWKEQNKKDIARRSNYPQISSFQFMYTNILGGAFTHEYKLSSEDEGMMLFFPSKLSHQVYPFYDCDEDRISVSGNIVLNTTKVA